MTTNGMASEDKEMVDCEDGKVVTMMDVLQEQQEFEEDANAVLGASDDKNCTYSKGYIKRQAIYACLTCCVEAKDEPSKRAGVCLACSLACHENHELIELYTKRNFRCDCGNPKFNSHPCQFTSIKPDLNEENQYNQNFSGLYCICHRPYPDPEIPEEDEMIQCIICEDWLHSSHLEAIVPGNDQYTEMICKACMEANQFLHDYGHLAVNVETEDIEITVNGTDNSILNEPESKSEFQPEDVSNDVKIDSNIDKNGAKDDVATNATEDIQEDKINVTEEKENSENINLTDNDKTKVEEKSEDSNNQSEESNLESSVMEQTSQKNVTDNDDDKPDSSVKSEENSSKIISNEDNIPESEHSNVNDNSAKEEAPQELISTTSEELKVNTESELNDLQAKASSHEEASELSDRTNAEQNSDKTEILTNQLDVKDKVQDETMNMDIKTDQDPSSINVESSESNNDKTNDENEKASITNDIEMKDDLSKNDSIVNDNESHKNIKENKRKLSTEESEEDKAPKKSKIDENNMCIRPCRVKRKYKGATFWSSDFRQKLCTCNVCIAMYKDLSVLYLIDVEDTVTAYETLGMEKIDGAPVSQYEKGLEALSSLDRVQQINALTEYNKMKDKLLDFLKSFKDRKEIVKEEDIKAFFAGMKPKREPDGVYFCR